MATDGLNLAGLSEFARCVEILTTCHMFRNFLTLQQIVNFQRSPKFRQIVKTNSRHVDKINKRFMYTHMYAIMQE